MDDTTKGKSTFECLITIFFYTVKHTYIQSSNPKKIPSFKTLDLAAVQTFGKIRLTRRKFEKYKHFYKKNQRPNFSAGRQKLTVAPRTL